MKIAIRFGDNDFIKTFEAVLHNFYNATTCSDKCEELTKEQLVTIINELSFGCYLLFQNRFQYYNDESYEHIRKHLKITEEQLFIGEEVDSLLEREYLNSEIFVLNGTDITTY